MGDTTSCDRATIWLESDHIADPFCLAGIGVRAGAFSIAKRNQQETIGHIDRRQKASRLYGNLSKKLLNKAFEARLDRVLDDAEFN